MVMVEPQSTGQGNDSFIDSDRKLSSEYSVRDPLREFIPNCTNGQSDRGDTEPWVSLNYYELSNKVEAFKGTHRLSLRYVIMYL